MTRASKLITVNVSAPTGTPNPGQVLLIGTNTLYSTVDSARGFVTNSTGNSSDWSQATLGAYGGGAFCPNYGTQGGYIAVGTGGHDGAYVYDGVVFDFETETWSRLANQNGGVNTTGQISSGLLNQYGEYPSGCPTPCHNYANPIGVGADILMPLRTYASNPLTSWGWVHRFTTNRSAKQGTWTRVSSNATSRTGDPEGGCLYDDRVGVQKVYQYVQGNISPLPVYDIASGQWSAINLSAAPNPDTGTESYPHYLIHHQGSQHCLFNFWGGGSNAAILNLDNIAAGWSIVSISGAVPSFGMTRWAYYPADGRQYAFHRDGTGQTVWRLTPPANLFSGTWTFSTVTPTSGSFPQRTTQYQAHYTCFMYVPARSCFAWIAGAGSQVALWKP